MERIEDGGPAFPALYEYTAHGDRHAVPLTAGMSLRDWFAGQALQAMLCADSDLGRFRDEPTRTAQFAYLAADAMLKARAR